MHKEIELLARYAPRLLPDYYSMPSCCIAATAITIDVLAAFGIKAIPFPVKAMIFNRPFMDVIRQAGTIVSWEDAAKINPDVYSVGIGYDAPSPGGYNGHLITLANENVLIDLTLPQVNRPKYDLLVPPLVVEVTEGFLKGDKPLLMETDKGCLLAYNLSSNLDYLKSPDWLIKERRQEIVERLVRRIRNH